MNHGIEPNQNALSAGSGLARIERTFANLVNLVKARGERSARLLREAQQDRPSRSEIFRQMQHEKWLGGDRRRDTAGKDAAPKDLYRRVLLDPNAATGRKPGTKAGR